MSDLCLSLSDNGNPAPGTPATLWKASEAEGCAGQTVWRFEEGEFHPCLDVCILWSAVASG